MARNEHLDDNISCFLQSIGINSDNDTDMHDIENKLMFHTLESLGTLLHVAVKNNARSQQRADDDQDEDIQDVLRRSFSSALHYFADNIKSPPDEDIREPYPEKWLKESFPDSAKEEDGRTWLPLQWALKAADSKTDMLGVEDAEILLKEYQSVEFAVSPLSMAVAKSEPCLDVVRSILHHNPSAAKEPDRDKAYPFMYACAWNRNIETVELLHSQCPATVDKADIYGFRALHYASYVGSLDMVRYLLRLNPRAAQQPNRYGVLPLNACVVNRLGSLEMTRLIYEAHPPAVRVADENGLLPLHKAAQHASMETIQFLLEAFPEAVNLTDEEGLLPLHYSGIRVDKDLEIQQFILEASPKSAADSARVALASSQKKECVIM